VEILPIGVTGAADQRMVAGLREIAPLLRQLRSGVLVIGGLMVRLWLHARPLDVPVRPTADIDLGVNRRVLRLAGDRQLVGPLLQELHFKPGYAGEPFRYWKDVEGVGTVLVDVVVPPGSSREEPPIVERGLQTVAAPGLAYAMLRPPVHATGAFIDGDERFRFDLPIPTLDSAFVLKAALVESGVRTRPDRIRSDTVDAMMMAAACLSDPAALRALQEHLPKRRDVGKSVRWLDDVFRSPTAIGSRRVEDHFRDEGYREGMGVWAYRTAEALLAALRVDASQDDLRGDS
jgi:hypothetical protein